MPAPGPSDALVTGVATALWYALPDHVRSRRRRALLKVGILGALVGWSALSHPAPPTPSVPAAAVDPTVVDGEREPTRAEVSRTAARTAVALAAVGAGAALAVAAEEGLYRFGERSARRGARLPHTRDGLVLGAASALLGVGLDRVPRRPGSGALDPQDVPSRP